MTPKTRRSDDSGAALILALVFITVVAVVVAVVLSFADSSFRTTMALRDQAAISVPHLGSRSDADSHL